ncbi:MAG: DUF1634 domain-containing protein [Lactobacillaceae bacterium]|jgi:uncharacterized membrane protein|nr:DUF1634 domain-containing protein [Lactobacillaceae bacterium]
MQNKQDLKMEQYIGYVLRIGAGIAFTLMGIGLVLGVIGNALSTPFMMYGVLVLIVTPTIRVIASIFMFAKDKDYKFVWITVIVLLILVVAFLIGKA